jgi:valyl-tRNA synthetase
MDARYDHSSHEPKIYVLWQEAELFNPDVVRTLHPQPQEKTFSIIMPPPNANDALHIGHALFVTIEDIMIRYHRMLGEDTVWIPGTDHAGIETQFLYEKKLAKQGKSRFQFDRETLFGNIWQYVQENSGVAIDQMKKLGASADWSRYHFTLDLKIVSTVLQTFRHLHEENLLYRGLRLVNYCTKCGTSYSELEVKYEDRTSKLYFVKYRFVDDPAQFVSVATVRPEPIFADTHLAVHPADPKRKHLIGKKVLNPLTQAEMEIIGDEYVDPAFGTGVVKLTPAHDPNDFEVAKKHSLPIQQAITTQGKIAETGGVYASMSVIAAREQVVADLQAADLIEKIDESYQNRVGVCYRCGRAIEPLPLPQFFISIAPLTKRVLEALDAGDVRIHGAGREKVLRHWLSNLQDWNISRQIVWGIKIPVWYQVTSPADFSVSFIDTKGQFYQGTVEELLHTHTFEEIVRGLQQVVAPQDAVYEISVEQPPGAARWLPETDTFDTWFSSGQWPFATLQNSQSGDFDRFYPTQVMETGYDILPFWVMRMLLLGLFETGRVPFEDVYLHGLVRDSKGQKMSKSKGNVTNPLEIVEKYGADALRMALVIRSTPGQDKSVGEADFKAMRNLANKIWNAARYVLLTTETAQESSADNDQTQPEESQEFSSELAAFVTEITTNLHDLKPGLAAENTYNSFWHWYCDTQIEQHKSGRLSTTQLLEGLLVFLKLLHPFVPFVTEAVWQECQRSGVITETKSLSVAHWPS